MKYNFKIDKKLRRNFRRSFFISLSYEKLYEPLIKMPLLFKRDCAYEICSLNKCNAIFLGLQIAYNDDF